MKASLIIAASLAAIIVLAVLIWFVFPLVSVAGVAPFENVWLRLALIAVLLAGFTVYHTIVFYRRAQAQKKIEASLTAAGDNSSDAKVLSEKMTDAIQTLKTSAKSKGNFLYELPWYVIIGPPGAGKTTALLNSGLKFPLLGTSGKASVAGAGGTRYCDWWFTEDAVFIDTAGRYTTHDSDAEADRRSWFAFLDLLRGNRPRQPINGVIVAIGIDELMRGNQQEIAAQSNAVRRRLAELHERLKIDFPVYVMFTKADLIAGFSEFFGHYDENSRKQVWGATFQTTNKLQNKVGEVEGELDVLVERLLAEMPDRLQDEADPISRVRLFGLASQMAALKPAISDFLTQIFEPTRYHQNAALRGFYFTSGTQEGTPIDKLLSSMTGSFGIARGAAPAYSGKEKGYFLANLLNRVILGEAGWVSTNAEAVRRAHILRAGSYAVTCIVAVAALAGWWNSYRINDSLIAGTNAAAAQYREAAQDLLTDAPIGDTDFLKVLPHLDALARLPAGPEKADVTPDVEATLGLSQWRRLRTSSDAAYRDGLNRLLRSRLVLHMENRLAALQGKPDLLYEPLKAYMMLGGDPNVPVDPALIGGWMQADWEMLYPGEPNRPAREDLRRHLDQMLRLEPGTRQIITLNGALVKATQSALLSMPLADRAFALLKSTSAGAGVADWTLAAAAGPDASLVFETLDGQGLDSVRVPAMFTYDGFYNLFLARMAAVIDLLGRERWLLGEAGQEATLTGQYETLGPDLLQRYDQEFLTQWPQALARIRIKNLAAGAPDYPALQAAGGALSPLKLVIQSIASETRLTKPRGGDAAGGEQSEQNKVAQDAALKAATDVLRRRMSGTLGNMAQIGLDAARKAEGRGGEVIAVKPPGATVEEQFRRYHELTEGKAGKTQLDILVDQLKGLHQSLVAEQTAADAAAARAATLKFMSAISASASRLEAPFSAMLKTAMGDFEDKIVAERVSDLKGQLTGSVTRRCLDVTANRYPFSPGSKKDVPLTEFGRLFGPGGTFDQFYRDRLAGLVDTSGQKWRWKQNSKLGQELSDDALVQFQNASRIRDAYFTGQGSAPNIRFAAAMTSLSQQSPSVTLEVNGNRLESPFGVESRGDFEWPGSSPDGSASITMPEAAGSPSALSFRGPWALHRLINAGAMKQSGNKISVRFVVGGREVAYQLTFDTLDNPFTLIQRLKFDCPKGL